MRSWIWLALAVTACTGAPPAEQPPDEPKKPAIPVRKSLPKAKSGGPQALTQANVRKAFEPEATVKGTEGRKCGAWRDRVILTRPNAHDGYDLRVRPRTDDLDRDCRWEGPVLIEARVSGEVVGSFWPHIVTYKDLPLHSGRIQVVQGTTGGVTADIVDATKPRYERQLVITFEVPVVFEPQRAEDQSCGEAITAQWHRMLPELRSSGTVHPDLPADPPHCPPAVTERFCDRYAFLVPHELVLGEAAAHPANGIVGCAHVPD